jgi:uncharacterized protein (TIGR03437 family)
MPPDVRRTSIRCRNNFLVFVSMLLSGSATIAGDRIVTSVDPQQTFILKSQSDPRAQPRYDIGKLDPSTKLGYLALLLKPSAELDQFVRDQQEPASANYHRWITPEQFADRFGLSKSDIGKLTSWLESQGLTVNDVARGRHWITFSGTADQVSHALRTEIHRYQADGKTHFANATAPSIPAAFQDVVSGIRGLTDFGLKPLNLRALPEADLGDSHYLAPDDVATIYDITPLFNAGISGAGQKLVVVGQTDIDVTDIQEFRAQFNLPANDPQLVLYGTDPGTSYGDLPEADLDIEWSGSVARDATIVYVYSQDVFTSAQYAIDQNLAPVMTMSYGGCELWAAPGYEGIAQQANAQGITWMVASGDWGAATCDISSPTPQAAKGPTVSFPADLPEVTAVGGTEFDEGAETYWSQTNTANGASALSWIPEMAWNDSVERNGLAATGGGPSALFTKPFWQTGPGVPDDNARDLPDVALSASPDHDGYEVYTGGYLNIYGGTSVASPIFAGIVALLNQETGAAGQGNINPALYKLAQSSKDAFHDVTIGNNMVSCVQSSPGCSNGLMGFSAGPGYDMATGLGSVDAWRLISEWTTGATASTTTLTANPSSFNLTDTVQLAASVSSASSTTAPTGTITFLANDNALGSVALVGSGTTATANLSSTGLLLSGGNGIVTALYSGDGTFSASAGTTKTSLTLPASGALLVPSLTPNPVPRQNTPVGGDWPYTVKLTEKAGVSATLTLFTINGQRQNLAYWSSTSIPANGSISAQLLGEGLTPPVNRLFHFAGVDATRHAWTQDLTVTFAGTSAPGLAPSMTLASTPATVLQDLSQPPACQWSHQLIVREQAGFEVQLTGLFSSGANFSSQIQQLFGTTQLAPYGMLRANICRSGVSGLADTYTLSGISEVGTFVTSSLAVSFSAAMAGADTFTVSPTGVILSAPDGSQPANSTVNLDFTAGTPDWTAQVLPGNRTSTWLTVSPLSGSGSAQLQLNAAAGLSDGVYQALIAVQPTGVSPQSITVPVTFVVGASTDLSVNQASNAASYANVYAPGMALAVFGTNLAPATETYSFFPLPLTMQGVSATVNGVAAPLYYVSPTQINLQIPYETTLGAAVLGINNNGKVTSFSFPVTVAGPGIFADVTGALAPVSTGLQGQDAFAYITGDGVATPMLATGAAPYTLTQPILPVTLTVGGVPATINFIDTWAAGVTEIDFTIPAAVPTGPQPVVVTVGGVASPPVTLNVTALRVSE